MKVLVSVRNLAEARLAAQAGVAFIDLKEPAGGALGGVPVSQIGPIVLALRQEAPGAEISATIGDWAADALPEIEARCHAVAATGVDHVKVGVVPGPGDQALCERLGQWCERDGLPIVPVLIADHGVPGELLGALLRPRFAALMLDTAAKTGGSLLARCGEPALRQALQQAQARGRLFGLAGALRRADLPMLARLAPDFAGFRSAVCAGDRGQALDAACLAELLRALRGLDREAQPA